MELFQCSGVYLTLFLGFLCVSVTRTGAQPYISTIGRALEGSEFSVKCVELSAGAPVQIRWSRVDKSGNPIGGEQAGAYTTRDMGGIHESTSLLTLDITRQDDSSELTCTTTSSTGQVQTTKIRIYVDVTPSTPFITGETDIAEGQNASFVCTVAEAKPAATISWRWSTGTPIQDDVSETTKNTDSTYKTVSELTFIATQSLNQRSLFCEVSHTRLVNRITADVTINVIYKPSVSVDTIYYQRQVGAQLVIKCSVTSNPPAISVGWLKNGTAVTLGPGYSIGSNEEPSLTIDRVSEEDAGLYVCTATNDAGTLRSDTVRVEVTYLPKVTLPGSKSFRLEEGERVTLQCDVEADPAANFVVWLKGSTALIPLDSNKYEGSTPQSPSLVIKSVSRSDAGRYQCTAENNVGTSSSIDTITLVVNYPPTVVTVTPATQTVVENNQVTLRCIADGEPTPQYRWYKDDVVVGNSDFLNIQSVKSLDNGVYTCSATNSKGSKNQTGEIIVRYKPEVVIPLDSYGGDEGESVTIPCFQRAFPDATSMVWVKDNSNIDVPGSGGKYAGGTLNNTNLTISNLANTDSGVYKCMISNSVGTGEDSANLGISFAPVQGTITNPKPNPEEGEPITLTCGAQGVPEPRYTWYKNGEVINVGKTLTIPAVNTTDTGQYICLATNEKGNTTSTATLDVKYSPKLKFTGGITGVSSNANSVVVVPLEIRANPAATSIIWYKNGVPFTLLPVKYGGGTVDNPALVIKDVNPTDNGVYQAEVTNAIGTNRSPIIRVSGLLAPTDTRVDPVTQIVKENEPFNIDCLANGSPTPEIYWTRGEETARYFEGSSSLAVSGATPRDNTYFTCWVSNEAGNDSARANVVVLYKPYGRTDNSYDADVGDTIVLNCPVLSNPAPTSYRWWFKDTLLTEKSQNLTVSVNSTLFGRYVCRATNSQGESDDVAIFIQNKGTVGESTDEPLSLTYIVLIVLIIIILLALIIIAIIFCCKQGLCRAVCGKRKNNNKSQVSPEPEAPVMDYKKTQFKSDVNHIPFNGYTSSSSTVSRQDVEVSMNGSTTGRPKTARPKTARISIEEGSQYNRLNGEGTGPIISIMEPSLNSARAHQLPPLPGHEQIEETPVKKMKRKRKRRHKPAIREEEDAALTENQQIGRETPISD